MTFLLVTSITGAEVDQDEEEDNDEDYKPVENQKLHELDDYNFEEVTHACEFHFF